MFAIKISARGEKLLTFVALLILVMVGFRLRIAGAATRPVTIDEAYFMTRTIFDEPTTDGPLAPLLLRPFFFLIEFSRCSLSLWAALWGTAAIAAFYLLARRIFGSRSIALGCASFLTFSPLAVVSSQNGRPYPLLLCLLIFAYYFFLRARAEGQTRFWVLFGVFATLATLTHLVAIQVLVAFSVSEILLFVGYRLFGLKRRPPFSEVVLTTILGAAASGLGLLDFLSPINSSYLVSEFASYPQGMAQFLRSVFRGLAADFNLAWGPIATADCISFVFLLFGFVGLFTLSVRRRAELAMFLVLTLGIPMAMMFLTLAPIHSNWLRYISHLVIPFGLLVGFGAKASIDFLTPRAVQEGFKCMLLVLVFAVAAGAVGDQSREYSEKGPQDFSTFLFNWRSKVPDSQVVGLISTGRRVSDVLWYDSQGISSPPPIFFLNEGGGQLFEVRGEKLPGYEILVPTETKREAASFRLGSYLLVVQPWAPKVGCEVLSSIDKPRLKSREIHHPAIDARRNRFVKLCEVYE